MTTRRTRYSSAGGGDRSDRARADMTPMIDVTFLLLIFFMLTIQFKSLEGQIAANMPEGVGDSGPSEPRDDIRLRIEVLREGTRLAVDSERAWTGEGPWRFGPDRLVRWSVGPWSTHEGAELAARLVSLSTQQLDRQVVIDARAGVVYSEAVFAVDSLRLAGWNDISFAAAAR